ncbi:MAG: hypothetical protein K6348_07340 [Deferribacterales bacterium]
MQEKESVITKILKDEISLNRFIVVELSYPYEYKNIEVIVNKIDKKLENAIRDIPMIDEISVRVIKNEHKIIRGLRR